MSEIKCENCGSNHIVEENGIATCKACETKYPDLSLNKIGIEEDIKEQEIRRLYAVQNPNVRTEPKVNILTDDEILKYAPNSDAAFKIKAKRSGKLFDQLKVYEDYLIIFGTLFSIFFACLLIYLF